MGVKLGTLDVLLKMGSNDVTAAYLGGILVYQYRSQDICFDVVEYINQYHGSENDVYEVSSNKWYKLNNIGQYEQYGLYADSIASSVTTYQGKLSIYDGYEYIYSGSSWVNVGAVQEGISDSYIIPFEDTNVKSICVTNWGNSVYAGEITYGEAKQVTSLGTVFKNNTTITKFNELVYFTGLTGLTNGEFIGCRNLTEIVIPANATLVNGEGLSSKAIFSGCTNLSAITFISDSSTTMTLGSTSNLGSYYMSSNHSSTPMVLPNRPLIFTDKTFSYYDYLVNAYFQTQTPPSNLANSDINASGKLQNVYCPVGAYNAYATELAGKNKAIIEYDFVTDANGILDKEKYWTAKLSPGIYPLYYDGKTAPPDNVTFSSMTEAEQYECPWVGMNAAIDGTDYIFDENYSWVTKYGVFDVSGETVCYEGDKYQKVEIKVRNVDDSWSSQNPPVYDKGELIESASTECSKHLPSGYTELEYVENTGNSYIITSLYFYDVTGNSFTINAKISSAPSTNDFEYMFSTEQGNIAPYTGFVCRWYQRHFGCGGDIANTYTTGITLNQDSTSSVTISCASNTTTNTTPLSLWCGMQGGTIWRKCKGKQYSLQAIKNGELAMDLVPASRDLDGVVGLYDLVTNTFLYPPNYQSYPLVGGNPV